MYETNRENFDKIMKAYENYVVLYKLCNNNSIEGVSGFAEFYFRWSQYNIYQDPTRMAAVSG